MTHDEKNLRATPKGGYHLFWNFEFFFDYENMVWYILIKIAHSSLVIKFLIPRLAIKFLIPRLSLEVHGPYISL